jgi:hypothetical protein
MTFTVTSNDFKDGATLLDAQVVGRVDRQVAAG